MIENTYGNYVLSPKAEEKKSKFLKGRQVKI